MQCVGTRLALSGHTETIRYLSAFGQQRTYMRAWLRPHRSRMERIRPAGSAVRAHGGFASLVAARRLLIPVIGVGCIALLMGGIWLYQMRGPIPRSAPDPSSLQPAQGRAEAPVSHTPVKEVFEKHKLLGIFASDRGKPPSTS